ncbi:MAG: dual specificity protein phosphatase family protein, partial [Acidobacteriaceae bacterium]|nr:dual specificity protein phosphatase family protein [Acidobacteriaceae bacterium]
RRVLSLLLQNDSQPVFVHCRRGKDRTGTVVACYRIQHDRWKNEDAFDEAKKYGMSFAERGMRAYILHFSPLPITDVSTVPTQAALPGVAATPAQP